MTSETNNEYSAERRRNVRRDFERGVLSNSPDKYQMNDLALGALVVIAAVLSLTDFSFSAGDWKNLTALTLFLYVITMFVYRNRYEKGMSRGRLDKEYIDALSKYRAKIEDINAKSIVSYVPSFCTFYKKQELKEYRKGLLCDVDIDYDTYKEKYIMMARKDVLRLPISMEAKAVILKCNRAKPIKLFPGLILNESGETDRSKLIGKSGRARERQDKKRQAITRAAYVLFGAAVAFDMIFNFSLETIAQWVVRMLPVLLASISGDDGGFCNITVTETNFKRDQINVINLFFEYAKRNNLIDSSSEEKVTEDIS
jgi:hypothetical protein